jgi:putative membrane protein
MMGGMDGMMGAAWMPAIMWINLLLGLALVALAIIGVIAGIRWLTRSAHPSGARGGSDHALEILRERYARGEISRDEFERMRQDLMNTVGR